MMMMMMMMTMMMMMMMMMMIDDDEDSNNNNKETGSRSPCMRPRSDPPKMKNSTPDKIVAKKKKK